jgi:hypothetical protein
MDLSSQGKWFEYSRARGTLLRMADTQWAPWYILRADDTKRARLNRIRHIVSPIPYRKGVRKTVSPPKRSMKGTGNDPASQEGRNVVPEKH